MYDDLARIERCYGSVAEYNRCMQERDEMEYEYDLYDAPYEEDNVIRQFNIGDKITQYGLFGGITTYTVKEIDRENNRIFFTEVWSDVDGVGTRPGEWHMLTTDQNGNEMALEFTSKEYGDVWICANN